MVLKDSYTEKYKDYFSYNSFFNYYIYNFRIRNFNDNSKWPLNECPNCSNNLQTNQPKKVGIEIESKLSQSFVITLVLVGIAIVYIAFALKANLYLSLLLCVILGFFLTLYLNKYISKKPIILYFCDKCGVLLHNQKPEKIVTSQNPKHFFEKLEKLNGIEIQ